MSETFPTVTVTCPCGTSFDRPVKRGRPAIWCLACREIPMAQRVARASEDGVVAEKRTSSFGEHDACTAEQRDSIEEAYASLKVAHKAMIASGSFASTEAASEWFAEATREIYKKAGHKSWVAAPKKTKTA